MKLYTRWEKPKSEPINSRRLDRDRETDKQRKKHHRKTDIDTHILTAF